MLLLLLAASPAYADYERHTDKGFFSALFENFKAVFSTKSMEDRKTLSEVGKEFREFVFS